MVVWRRWVFPILMVVILGAAAAALVKIAFFPDQAPAAALEPSAQIADPTVVVDKGEVVNALTLTGTIARDAAYPVRSTVDGVVTSVDVGEGQTVAAGQKLFTIKQNDPVKNIDVVAPEAGEVTEIAVVKGQPASIGGELVTLTPARYHVQATVDPVQLYRLQGAPSEASVTIQGGPAPFTCTGLKVEVAEDGTTTVTCAVPTDQTVFAGLQAELDVDLGTVSDVLVVPTTAVKGGAGTGVVWVSAGTGDLEERDVTLGVSDGKLVEVTGGLEAGEQVRQYVPGVAAGDEETCYDDGMGGQYCEPAGWNW
ncbi:HlyD family efflux transporter periplasmic adaptor subunit [Microbacterium sp. QXD-8]|uniref:HlyD family efflux transporter periplasmic adaptor subunit n=1 Tax=Microbacterium psychrotolerans TaxID=3068321 RepID=A0ABU0Z2J5_9MICO|nr:HlyD family efflux transporter periplasmic adaptor subunit [Microbacterium sp. QXD-8]MDQ7878809.1 HlyD family efflux transporter periplasmic adaptor subunit [Microbacterium sp. QXD-8]